MDDRVALKELAASEIADCKRHYDLGDYRFLAQAVRLALRFGIPVPEWASGEAEKAMIFYFQNGGSTGKGKAGGNLARNRWNRIHRERHRIADRELARGGSQLAAFMRASEILRGTNARATWREVKKSYRRIEAALNRDL